MKAAEKRAMIEAAIMHYVPLLDLTDWTLTTHYFARSRTKGCIRCGGGAEQASCEAEAEYDRAVLHFNLRRLPEPDVPLARTVLHELLHCITWDIEELAERWAGNDRERYRVARKLIEHRITHLEGVLWAALPRLS